MLGGERGREGPHLVGVAHSTIAACLPAAMPMMSRRAASPATSTKFAAMDSAKSGVVSETDRPRQRVMFELRDEVGGNHRRIRTGRGDHDDLARTRQLIDADRTEDLVLGEGHKCVARPHDLVDTLDALGSERERRDRLRAARGHHLSDAKKVCGRRDQRMHAAGWRRRAGDHDPGDAGDLRGDHRHEHRARVRRAAAGDVASDPPERLGVQPCPSRTAIEDVDLQDMELTKSLRGGGERIAHRLFEVVPRSLHLRWIHARRLDVDTIDPVRPLAKRRVPTGSNVGDDVADGVARADRTVKELLESIRGGRIDVAGGEAVALTLDDDGSELQRVRDA